MNGRIVVIDDDSSMAEMLADGLESRGYEVRWFTTVPPALKALEEQPFDAVITDLQLKQESGLDLCKRVVTQFPEMPVLVITAFGTMDAAIAAIRAGAYDFINKPIDLGALGLIMTRAIDHGRLKREVRRLRDAAKSTPSFDDIVGESRAMKKVFDLLDRLAGSDAATLVCGESGTGKELVARALHSRSRNSDGPFVPINCAAIPATLLESTLFGHVKGAFTDARQGSKGLFLEADGGTLFLDEIGEMPAEMQSKLLRVLQERKVRPVGGTTLIDFDTRVVSATNRDLDAEVETGSFREDLYYRLAVVTIDVPPLRARGNDVLLLAQHFLDSEAERAGKPVQTFASEAAKKLRDYDWPGNVRQLQNVIERAVALTRFDSVTVADLPERVAKYQSNQLVIADDDPDNMLTLEELERRYIARVMKTTGNNKTQAAKVLGVDRRTLYRKLERYEAAAAD